MKLRYEPTKGGLYWFTSSGALRTFGDGVDLRRPPLKLRPYRVFMDIFNPNPVHTVLPLHSIIHALLGIAEAGLRRLKGQEVCTVYWANDRGRAMALYLAGLKHVTAQDAYTYACVNELQPAWGELSCADTKEIVRESLAFWAPLLAEWDLTYQKIVYESDLQKILVDDLGLATTHPVWFGDQTGGMLITRSDGSPLYAYADVVGALKYCKEYDEVISFVGREQQLFGSKLTRLMHQLKFKRTFEYIPLLCLNGQKMSKRKGNVVLATGMSALARAAFRWKCLRTKDVRLDVNLEDLETSDEAKTILRLLNLMTGSGQLDPAVLMLYYNLERYSSCDLLDRLKNLRVTLNPEMCTIVWTILQALGFIKDLTLLKTNLANRDAEVGGQP